jgi:hypothetical protein
MRGLDKWRKDTLFKISEMDFYDALHFIEDEIFHKCDYCAYEGKCDEVESCEMGIKKYLCAEVENE